VEYTAFIENVRQRAGLETTEEAKRTVEATLETLGEHLYLHRRERRHLASQLPTELKSALEQRQGTTHFSVDEFYDRVGARADLSRQETIERATAVIDVLREAVAPGEWEHIVSELPQDYEELLAGSTS